MDWILQTPTQRSTETLDADDATEDTTTTLAARSSVGVGVGVGVVVVVVRQHRFTIGFNNGIQVSIDSDVDRGIATARTKRRRGESRLY